MSIEWAAGLFEGEGHIAISAASPALRTRGVSAEYRAVRLSLAMTDEDVVRRFADVVGCGRIDSNHDRRGNRKPCWRWRCNRDADAHRVLTAFLPLLGARRSARAQDALEVIEGHSAFVLCP